MTYIYFVYGLSFFSLGLTALIEANRPTKLPISSQLLWLAYFGITHSLVEWSDMFLHMGVQPPVSIFLPILRSILLPLSALFLARFGFGLLRETGPLLSEIGSWLLSLSIPVGLFISYVVIQVDHVPDLRLAAEVGSRYLIYFPANLLTAFGLLRHRSGLKMAGYGKANNLLLWAAFAFILNGFMAGLIVPAMPHGLASWLNDNSIQQVTGMPVQIWRAISALSVTFFIMHVLNIFDMERKIELAKLEQATSYAQQALLSAEIAAHEEAQNWNNALVEISRCIAEIDNTDDLLLKIVDTARRLIKADMAFLGSWNQDRSHLELKCFATESERRLCSSEPITDPILLATVISCRSACYPQDYGDQPAQLDSGVINHVVKNAAIVTLKLDNQPFGAIWVCRENDLPFSQNDVAYLEHLADQAVIAISHSIMAAKLQSLAVMDERSRIAREMHFGSPGCPGRPEFSYYEIAEGSSEYRPGSSGCTRKHIKPAYHSFERSGRDTGPSRISGRVWRSDRYQSNLRKRNSQRYQRFANDRNTNGVHHSRGAFERSETCTRKESLASHAFN